jgi:hypothetical protein
MPWPQGMAADLRHVLAFCARPPRPFRWTPVLGGGRDVLHFHMIPAGHRPSVLGIGSGMRPGGVPGSTARGSAANL